MWDEHLYSNGNLTREFESYYNDIFQEIDPEDEAKLDSAIISRSLHINSMIARLNEEKHFLESGIMKKKLPELHA